MQTSGIGARLGKYNIALFYTGRKHAGENLANIVSLPPPELGPPIVAGDASSKNWVTKYGLGHGFGQLNVWKGKENHKDTKIHKEQKEINPLCSLCLCGFSPLPVRAGRKIFEYHVD
jgi:hypothetical protein